MYEAFHHLGSFYQAYRVMQDSGIWLVNVEQIAEYFFSKMIVDKKR